jgi:sterol desaturase/sphingolipid hydroxylase (fatty acid hydroxylase superfamily)
MLWKRSADKVRAKRLSKREPTKATIRHEIWLSTISAFIYALPAAIVIEMWKADGTALYSGPVTSLSGWAYIAVSMLAYMWVQDTYFYWTHRVMHHPKIFRWAHAGHHKSVQPTPWASFSFDPAEAVISAWLLPVMALFVPLHVGAALALLMIMTVNAVFNHAGWEIYPERWLKGRFGKVMITATHHNQHHTRFTGNYGLYFRFWDQWMGTDRGGIGDEQVTNLR